MRRIAPIGSYTLRADIGRPYVVQNVFDPPELSLGRVEACFLLVGRLAYRGLHHKAHAQADAKLPREMVFDVDVDIGRVPTYSKLGWVGDPEPSTMMSWSDANLFRTVFHELGRQRVYVKDATTLNESYARFVEQEGPRQFPAGGRIAAVEPEKRREAQLVALVMRGGRCRNPSRGSRRTNWRRSVSESPA